MEIKKIELVTERPPALTESCLVMLTIKTGLPKEKIRFISEQLIDLLNAQITLMNDTELSIDHIKNMIRITKLIDLKEDPYKLETITNDYFRIYERSQLVGFLSTFILFNDLFDNIKLD